MSTAAENIKTSLTQLQSSRTEKYIVSHALPVGLGGQISQRIAALRIGLAFDRKIVFERKDDPPYTQVFEDLNPVDLPTCKATQVFSLSNKIIDDVCFVDALQKEFSDLNNESYRVICERFKIPFEMREIVDGAIFDWMTYLESVREAVERDKKRLGIDSETLGVHIRRGDKTVETPYVPEDILNREVKRAIEEGLYRSVYIASDSPKALSMIRIPSGMRVIFDENEKRYNNANHKMLFKYPERAVEETYSAIKNIDILRSCGGIVGQNNAHFACLAASYILYKSDDRRRIHLINGNIKSEMSWFTRKLYFFRIRSRKFARSMLPSRTIEKRREKIR